VCRNWRQHTRGYRRPSIPNFRPCMVAYMFSSASRHLKPWTSDSPWMVQGGWCSSSSSIRIFHSYLKSIYTYLSRFWHRCKTESSYLIAKICDKWIPDNAKNSVLFVQIVNWIGLCRDSLESLKVETQCLRSKNLSVSVRNVSFTSTAYNTYLVRQ